MKNNISNEIRQNLKEATEKPKVNKEFKNPFDSSELIKLIVDYLKKNDDVSGIETNYEPYSVIGGDYIYFDVNVDGEMVKWVLALGTDESEE